MWQLKLLVPSRPTRRRFRRVSSDVGLPRRTARATAEGIGIGLTIARSIARAHGGDIEASSEGPEHGATFTLVLPGSAMRNAQTLRP